MYQDLKTLKVVIEDIETFEPLYKRVVSAIASGKKVRLSRYEKSELEYLLECRKENNTISSENYIACSTFLLGKR